jgi:hypothetical protein
MLGVPHRRRSALDAAKVRAPCGGADCLVPVTVGPFASCDLR